MAFPFPVVPKGWFGCPNSAGSLAGNTFFTFKTPLSGPDFDALVEKDKWTTEDVLETATKLGINLGLWIDLTFTNRYFSPVPIKASGIQYYKLKMSGHGDEPSQENVQQFIQVVKDFRKENPDSSVALHCTHGFNRTGYLIVCYLVEVMGYDVVEALAEFERSRGGGIFRQNYVDLLCQRFGGLQIQGPTVTEPEWAKDKDHRQDSVSTSSLTTLVENSSTEAEVLEVEPLNELK